MTSILTSIKKLLGVSEADTNFDTDITIHINTVFTVLTSLGIGPAEGFLITGKDDNWETFLGEGTAYNSVETYMYLKVKLIFDPPTSTNVFTAFENTAKELEWRLVVQAQHDALAAAAPVV